LIDKKKAAHCSISNAVLFRAALDAHADQ